VLGLHIHLDKPKIGADGFTGVRYRLEVEDNNIGGIAKQNIGGRPSDPIRAADNRIIFAR
jgi:hypothetical protein